MKSNASADLVLLSGAIVLLFLLTPFGIEGDGAGRYDALSRLLSLGYFSGNPYSLIGPIFSTPLWIVGHLHGTEEWWVARFNLIVFVVGLCVMYWALVGEFDRRTSIRFLLVLTVASMFPHHDSRYYGEVFTACTRSHGSCGRRGEAARVGMGTGGDWLCEYAAGAGRSRARLVVVDV